MSEKHFVLNYWGVIEFLAQRRNQTRGEIRSFIRTRWKMDWRGAMLYELDHPYHKNLKKLKDRQKAEGYTDSPVTLMDCATENAFRKKASNDER